LLEIKPYISMLLLRKVVYWHCVKYET